MRNLRDKYRAWRERRQAKYFAWWERKRAKGKPWYVLWVTLFWGGWMIAVTSLYEYFRGRFDTVEFIFKFIYYPIGGWLIGLLGWRDNEKRYQNYLKTNPAIDVSAK